jgi:LPS sulfotransferase NodH
METRFDAFVLLAGMRTGSNFLEANLNALPGLTCHGELFNPHFIGSKDRTEFLGVDLAARDRNPLALLDRVLAAGPGLTGFRFFHDHDLRVLDRVLPDPLVAKIILTRNPLDSYVSWKIAQVTGQWKLTNTAARRSAQATFDATEFDAWIRSQRAFRQSVRRALQISGQSAFHISYDEVSDLAVLNGLARFLGIEVALEAPDSTLKRQNPEPLRAKVANPAEMEAALARMDPFGLDLPPETEPRRATVVPGYVVAGSAPLLFMPVPGGPEAEVADWLATLGTGQSLAGQLSTGRLRTGLTHRDLRQWKRAHPEHRSFAVLRHPLARAHAVFRDRVLGGSLPELRARLIRLQGLDLSPPGADAAALPSGTRRAAFLGFLQLVKQGLAGQAGLRVDACWATQTAVLQGHATLRPPDVLLREDGLAEGLARLAQDIGLPAPRYIAQPEPPPFHDDEIENAVREAYARDYLEFGFGPYCGVQAA